MTWKENMTWFILSHCSQAVEGVNAWLQFTMCIKKTKQNLQAQLQGLSGFFFGLFVFLFFFPFKLFINIVCLRVCECLFCFVLESWQALNCWRDVSVSLFRVVSYVVHPQTTNVAFQTFLKGVWVNLPAVWGWLLLSYGLNTVYCNCKTVHDNKVVGVVLFLVFLVNNSFHGHLAK